MWVVTVFGEMPLYFAKLACILLGMHIPCKAIAQGVALDDAIGAVGGVRWVHGNNLACVDGISVKGVGVTITFAMSSGEVLVRELFQQGATLHNLMNISACTSTDEISTDVRLFVMEFLYVLEVLHLK